MDDEDASSASVLVGAGAASGGLLLVTEGVRAASRTASTAIG